MESVVYNLEQVLRRFSFDQDIVLITGELATLNAWSSWCGLLVKEEIRFWLAYSGSSTPGWDAWGLTLPGGALFWKSALGYARVCDKTR